MAGLCGAPVYTVKAVWPPDFGEFLNRLDIDEILTAPRSPWQNPFAERLIGTLRRECLDHVIVWNERSLRRTLHLYLDYYHRVRTHVALQKDSPTTRAVQPPGAGPIVAHAHLGGLHHHYERRAA